MWRFIGLLGLFFCFENCQNDTFTHSNNANVELTPASQSYNEIAHVKPDSSFKYKEKQTTETAPVSPKSKITTIDFDTSDWVEVIRLDSTIVLDLRYATTDNFMEEQVYDCGRCFLRPPVAQAIAAAHRALQQQGLGLKMYDCYRPRPVQWKLWNKVPNPKYVADPRKGSMHNRGTAIDLTIIDATGQELDMGTPYDYFGREGWTFYENLPDTVLHNRKMLRQTLAQVGLYAIKTEWWHFSYRNKKYPIADFVWVCD